MEIIMIRKLPRRRFNEAASADDMNTLFKQIASFYVRGAAYGVISDREAKKDKTEALFFLDEDVMATLILQNKGDKVVLTMVKDKSTNEFKSFDEFLKFQDITEDDIEGLTDVANWEIPAYRQSW